MVSLRMTENESSYLGGKTSLGTSLVVAGAVARLCTLSLLVREHGPVKSEFHAARSRYFHAVLHPSDGSKPRNHNRFK